MKLIVAQVVLANTRSAVVIVAMDTDCCRVFCIILSRRSSCLIDSTVSRYERTDNRKSNFPDVLVWYAWQGN